MRLFLLVFLLFSCGKPINPTPAPTPTPTETPTPIPQLECGQDEYEIQVKILIKKDDGWFWSVERISGVCLACEVGKEYRLCRKLSNETYGPYRVLEEIK